MEATTVFDRHLIQRYDRAGPRYTSYPTAVEFHDRFTEQEYQRCVRESNDEFIPRSLSLYFHIPFCDTVCFYCACNKVVTKDHGKTGPYLQRLYREIELRAAQFEPDRQVEQLHWGGGTPTFLDDRQMRELMRITREHFPLLDDDQGEYSIELDPRDTPAERLGLLREIGFNRISFGVQDFEPQVQKAVNRIQDEAMTLGLMEHAQRSGFRSINVDLIYGLPLQTVESFDRTLDKIIDASPERLSIFNYAHLPERFKPQRRIQAEQLPSADEKLTILQHTIDKLTGAGYVYIGMDHFARPDDELAVAQRSGTLTRNFQGYTTHRSCDLVAMGVSAISNIGDCFSQNAYRLDPYYEALDRERLPIVRGVELAPDDHLRRAVIEEVICHFSLDIDRLEHRHQLQFHDYFAAEQPALQALEADGLIRLTPHTIEVLPAGRLLVRHVCMVFDKYLRGAASGRRFSKII